MTQRAEVKKRSYFDRSILQMLKMNYMLLMYNEMCLSRNVNIWIKSINLLFIANYWY